MKKMIKRLPVYFLTMAFIILKFSISAYASDLSGDNRWVDSFQGGFKEGSSLMTTKIFGNSNGFRWTYNSTDHSLTITGEDEGIDQLPSSLPAAILSNTKQIIFQDCVVTGGSMSYMFAGMRESLTSVDMSGLDTSKVTDMSNLFYWCDNLTYVNMSGLDTSNVTDMSDMFSWCDGLKNVDISGLDTSKVEDMSYMFTSCDSLTSVNMSGLDTSSVTDMSYMFSGCNNLTNVDMSGVDISKVEDMSYMFSGCNNLTGVDFDSMDTSKTTNVSNTSEVSDIFAGLSTKLTSMVNFIKQISVDMSILDTSNVLDMSYLFAGCKSLVSVDMSDLDVSNVIDMSYLFAGCDSLTSVDMSGLDTSKVLDVSSLLSGCDSLECIGAPKAMAAGANIQLPTTFEDSQQNTANEITSAHCNKVWAKEYDAREYSITYNLNEGKNNSNNPKSYTRHSKTITLQEPTKAGYSFKGWFGDEEFTQKITKIKMGNTGAVTLHAKWKINTYDIDYKLSGGTNSSKNPDTYKITTETIKLHTPTRKGFIFEGWYSDKAYTRQITEIPEGSTGDLTIYAKWKARKYDITYILKGGKNSSKNPKTYTVKTPTTTLLNPTKHGYEFEGWYSNKKRTQKVTVLRKGSTGDKTFYAKWRVSRYNIAFDGNGNTGGSMNSQNDCKYKTNYTLNANVFQRTGYTFAGWNTKADGSGMAYADKASVINLTEVDGSTVTLYAQWKAVEYPITYHLNGGVNSKENPTTYKVTTDTITLKNPTRAGYAFEGWYSDSNLTEKVTTIANGSTGDKVFYAKWDVSKYNITFNGNGSTSGSMASLSNCNYGSSYTLNTNVFQRTGYTFAGWNTKADGSGTAYADKASVSNLADTDGTTVTLYAQWKVIDYLITYQLNGGVNSNENPAAYNITTGMITLKNPTRTGYTFAGWYSDSNFTVKVTVINSGSTGSRVLYAKWSPVTYNITYKLNGGTNHSMNPTSYTAASSTIELQNPTKSGYTFAGWYSDKQRTKKVTKIKNGSTGNKTFYAKWKKAE